MHAGEPGQFLLPRDAYSSPGWFEREQRHLFRRSWAIVATTDDLSGPGDYVTADVGGVPLLLVVGDDGELRAFQNLCRHRGMVMVEGRGSGLDDVRCSYHDWRYDLSGALTVVPQRKEQFPDLCAEGLGLLPASVGVWEGMVFARVDPAAPPLRDELGGLPAGIGSHRPGTLPLAASVDLTARCNWKLLVENHIDVYHLWYLHHASLGRFDHRRFEHRQHDRHWTSYEPLRAGLRPEIPAGTNEIGHLSARDRTGIGAHLIFPNILLAANAEYFMSYAVLPVDPAESRIEVRIKAEPGSDPAALVRAARSFVDEDILACERIQRGLTAPGFEVGPLARGHEAPITAFHEHVLASVG
jgi:phenylpropionate dioxygenase-like ring-hydroxylating dioxygenase large terminal subunit